MNQIDTQSRRLLHIFLFKGARVFHWASGVAICAMVLITFIVVVGRYTPWASGALAGGHEISELLMGLVGVLGIAACWYSGSHISIGLMREHSSPRMRMILDAIGALMFALFFGVIAWGMWGVSIESYNHNLHTMLSKVPKAPFQFIFLFVAGHFAFVALSSSISLFIKATRRNIDSVPPSNGVKELQ